jgi:hypothetical protein
MPIANASLRAKDIRSSVHHFTNLEAHRTKGLFVVEHGEGICVYDARKVLGR